MNRLSRIGAVLLASTFCLRAAEPTASAKEAVLRAEEEWKTAVINSDRHTLEKLLAPDLSYTHSSAKTQTREEFIQSVTDGSTQYKSIDFENTRMRQYGSVMVITHSAVIVTVHTGKLQLYLTEVWAEQDGRWQMVSRQATKMP